MGNSNTSYNRDQPVIMDTNSVNNVYYTTSVTNTTGVCAYDSFLWLVCNQQYLLKRVNKAPNPAIINAISLSPNICI